MKKLILLVLIASAAHAAPANPADHVDIFGLPLGGKLKAPPRQCSMKEIGTDVRSLCWISPQFTHKGWRTGSIIVPGANTRPAWAAHGSFDAAVTKDGTLGELRVSTYPASKFDEIQRSIALRFGPPTGASSVRREAKISKWTRADIRIELVCAPKIDCITTFTSPARIAELEREQKAQQDKESARPLSM